MSDPVWIDPARIEFKISPVADLQGIVAGNWDLRRRHALDRSVKFRSIEQRFRRGRRWEETDLFRHIYARRFARGEQVRGAKTIEELAAQYYGRVDALHADLARDGFRLRSERGKPHPLPGLLIGRSGEIFIGNQGNHRLAIARVLGLRNFAGRIVCRHPLSTPEPSSRL
jgi:hypothetical protein